MSGSRQPEPGKGAHRFSLVGPVVAVVNTPNGAVEIRNSKGNDAYIEVGPENSSDAGQAEAAALLMNWMGRSSELTEVEVTGLARPECQFDVPVDVAAAHPMRVRLWLPAGSQFAVGTESATVSAEGRFDPSRVTNETWSADIELTEIDKVTTCWEQAVYPSRTVLRIAGTSGTVLVNRSGCDVAVDVDGPTTVQNVIGEVEIVNKNGSTRVESIEGSVRAQSDTGDLTARNILHRLDFYTISGSRDAQNVGTLGKYVRLDSDWLPSRPAVDVETTIQAVVSAAVAALTGGKKPPAGSPSATLDLPIGADNKRKLTITMPDDLAGQRPDGQGRTR